MRIHILKIADIGSKKLKSARMSDRGNISDFFQCLFVSQQQVEPYNHEIPLNWPCFNLHCDRQAQNGHWYCCAHCCNGYVHHVQCRTSTYNIPTVTPNKTLNGRILLVTAGYEEQGSTWLAENFGGCSAEQRNRICHRVDKIYTHRGQLHVRGTDCRAQTQLKQLHGKIASDAIAKHLLLVQMGAKRFGDSTLAHVVMCRHGHHRSVAHVEIVKQQIHLHFPSIKVHVLHLDHTHQYWLDIWDSPETGNHLGTKRHTVPEDDLELYDRLIYGYQRAILNPPPFLLHDWNAHPARYQARALWGCK